MAPVVASGPDLNNLSSNWKALQQRLKRKDAPPPKRKVDDEARRVTSNGGKRRKLNMKDKRTPANDVTDLPTRSSMGISGSKQGTQASSASLALWAEDNDIPAQDLAAAYGTSPHRKSIQNVPATQDKINEGSSPTAEAGKYIAVDCEMVGVGPDPEHDSALARVSIVNYHGHQLYDSFVLPKEAITDYRTRVSGVTPKLLQTARSLETVQADVAKLLDGKILVGHALRNDLDALLLGHPKRDIRDTSKHPAFRRLAAGRTPGLKKLARDVLGIDIQAGEHSSIEDARTTMLLFRRDKQNFDREHMSRWGADWRIGSTATNGEEKKIKSKEKKRNSKK